METFKMGNKIIAISGALFLLVLVLSSGCARSIGNTLDSADLISGWYDKEDGFRWMAKTAEADFKAGNQGVLHIEGTIRPKVYERIYHKNIELRVFIDDAVVAVFALPEGDFTLEKNIGDKVKGKEMVTLRLEANKSFIPSSLGLSDDERELGVMIRNIILK